MSETLSNGVSEQNQGQKKVKNNGESKAFKVKGKPKSYYVKRALGDYCKAMAEFEVVRKLGYINDAQFKKLQDGVAANIEEMTAELYDYLSEKEKDKLGYSAEVEDILANI